MPGHYVTRRSLPFLTAFSSKARDLAERAFAEQEARRRKASDLRAQQADQLVERVHRQLHTLLGTRKFGQLREAIQAERLTLRDLLQPPEGLAREQTEVKKAARRRIDSLQRRLGVDRTKLEKIIRAADTRIEDALFPDDRHVTEGFNLRNHFEKWATLSPFHKFPLPWGPLVPEDDPNDPHRWFLFRPPFFGFLFSQAFITSDNFRADRLLFLHPPSGLVGNEATMDCDDAGSFDVASVDAQAQIAFAFTPPAAGLVEVLIDAQSTIGTHAVAIEDEWGFSNAWCSQHNQLMMNVLHPNVPEPSFAAMSSMFKETDGDDLTAAEAHLARGQHFFAQLVSSGPVPAGQTVIVTAGTRTFDMARANDMELHSRSNFQWFISSVEVRIAP
ncbi:MAG TPA: hypothetical protein VGD94_06875 [Vicinamibacterales bacterium]